MVFWYIADLAAAQLLHLHHSCSVWNRSAVQKGSERDALWSSASPSPPWEWAFPAPTESAQTFPVSRVCTIPVFSRCASPPDLTQMFLLELLSLQSFLLLIFSWPPPSLWTYNVKKGVKKSQKRRLCPCRMPCLVCVLQLVVQRQRGMVWLNITKRNTQIMKEVTKHKWKTKLRRQTGSSELKWHDRFPLPCHYFSGSQRQGETDQYNAGQTDRQQFEVSPGFLCPSLWPWLLVMLITACKKM